MTYYSQKGQDAWVIEEVFDGKRDGYFLDLAAADGLNLSNTYTLEKEFGWSGICIEPNLYFQKLLSERRSCICTPTCIDADYGTVEFAVFNELGGIIDDDTDNNPKIRGEKLQQAREKGAVIVLDTVPLVDVLVDAKAPDTIDYFSFDVEGAETRILRNFPFEQYRFMSLTIERPTPELNALLFNNGYVFVRNSSNDSYYVHESLPNLHQLHKEPFSQIPIKDW